MGLGLTLAEGTEAIQVKKQIFSFVYQILNLPTVIWVLTGFLFIYFLLFVSPVFLNPNLQMNYFTGYIPNLNPIGNDLIVMVDLIQGWVSWKPIALYHPILPTADLYYLYSIAACQKLSSDYIDCLLYLLFLIIAS